MRVVKWFKGLYRNILRVAYWLPVIWKDRWWDSYYLLGILEHKLRYDAKQYRTQGVSVNSGRYAKQMRIAAELCCRLRNDNYTSPWDKEATESGLRLFNYMESNLVQYGDVSFCSSEGYKRDSVLSQKASWAHKRWDEMRDQDLKYLLKVLQKHLFSWWD